MNARTFFLLFFGAGSMGCATGLAPAVDDGADCASERFQECDSTDGGPRTTLFDAGREVPDDGADSGVTETPTSGRLIDTRCEYTSCQTEEVLVSTSETLCLVVPENIEAFHLLLSLDADFVLNVAEHTDLSMARVFSDEGIQDLYGWLSAGSHGVVIQRASGQVAQTICLRFSEAPPVTLHDVERSQEPHLVVSEFNGRVAGLARSSATATMEVSVESSTSNQVQICIWAGEWVCAAVGPVVLEPDTVAVLTRPSSVVGTTESVELRVRAR